MKNEKNSPDELDGIFSEAELEELEQELDAYIVKFPDDQQIGKTVDSLRQYVPAKRKKRVPELSGLLTLLKRSAGEVTYMSRSFWAVSALFFIIGYLLTVNGDFNPLYTLFILGPVPFIFGLLEVFKGRERGLMEMEMACKFSAHEIMLSRLLVAGIYNIVLNTVLMFLFAGMPDSAGLTQMFFAWLTPFTLMASTALGFSMKLRGSAFIAVLLSLWFGFTAIIISQPAWTETLITMHIGLHILFTTAGILLLGFQVNRLISKYSAMEEAGAVEAGY